jgi:hypothetical protein
MADEREQLIHAGRRRMGRATMRADHLGADLRRLKELLLGALPQFRAE